ncbi:MAG: hypothetical protein PHW21_03610 [Candidatus Izemoplasmatales bacterium]|nr:hypothetical protein [Candidatus Izemoplasmatales bacterium]
MKKLLVLLLGLVFSFGLTACTSEPLANAEKDYYVVGNFNDWANGTTAEYKMEAIPLNDARVKPLKDDLKGAKYLYILELTLPTEDAGWGKYFIIDEENTTVDGNQIIKIIRTDAGDTDAINWWAQSPESGKIDNLTPDTFWIPEFVENPTTTDTVGEGEEAITYTSGAWNHDSVALAKGTYYVVYVDFGAGSQAMGLIEKTAE